MNINLGGCWEKIQVCQIFELILDKVKIIVVKELNEPL